MITYVYVHDCPDECRFQGEEVEQRPTLMGSYYLMVPIRCVDTTAELKLVKVVR